MDEWARDEWSWVDWARVESALAEWAQVESAQAEWARFVPQLEDKKSTQVSQTCVKVLNF